MTTKKMLLLLSIGIQGLLLGVLPLPGQKIASKADGDFANQWTEVKSKYPAVAVEYLRRDAFVRAVGDRSVLLLDRCALYRALGFSLPQYCRDFTILPGNIGSCFKPQRTASGGYEMPDADAVQQCLDSVWKRQRR